MARTKHPTAPDDEELQIAPEEDAEPQIEEAAAPPEAGLQASQTQVTTHQQAVVIAKNTLQGTIAGAVAAKNAGGANAALVTAVKNADIAYYQAVVASAQAQGMPAGGAIDALKQLGAF